MTHLHRLVQLIDLCCLLLEQLKAHSLGRCCNSAVEIVVRGQRQRLAREQIPHYRNKEGSIALQKLGEVAAAQCLYVAIEESHHLACYLAHQLLNCVRMGIC